MTPSIIIAIISPILLTVGGIISWFLKTRSESQELAEERAREKRLEIYNIILDPYIVITTPAATKSEKEKALSNISSVKYKRAAFNLITFGSDETVRSFNKIMQYFFESKNEEDTDKPEVIYHFSNLVLNIRRDLYSKKSKLSRSEVIEFTITDMNAHRHWLDK